MGVHAHGGGNKVELGAPEVAVGATEGAKLGVGTVVVGKLGSAHLAKASLGHAVGRKMEVLPNAKGQDLGARLLRAERHAHGKRVIPAHHEGGRRRGRKRGNDGVLHVVNLASSIELVAEKVEKHEVAGLQLRQDVDGRELVGLHDRPVRTAAGQQRGSHAGSHVGARTVAQHRAARALDGIGQHVVGGCLAVGAADHNGALGELGCQVGYGVGVKCQGNPAGHLGGVAMEHAPQAP